MLLLCIHKTKVNEGGSVVQNLHVRQPVHALPCTAVTGRDEDIGCRGGLCDAASSFDRCGPVL